RLRWQTPDSMKPILLPFVAGAVFALPFAGCKKSSEAPQAAASSAGAAKSTATAGNPDDPAALKVRWAAGGRFAYRMELAQTIQLPTMPGMPGGAKPVSQEMTMGQDYSLNVLRERPDGGRDIEFAFDSISMSVARGGKEVFGLDTRGEAGGDE